MERNGYSWWKAGNALISWRIEGKNPEKLMQCGAQIKLGGRWEAGHEVNWMFYKLYVG